MVILVPALKIDSSQITHQFHTFPQVAFPKLLPDVNSVQRSGDNELKAE